MRITPILLSLAIAGTAEAQTRTPTDAEAARDFVLIDRELNAVYDVVTAKLRRDQQLKLVDAQEAWVAYRNAECDFGSLVLDRSARAAVLGGCLVRMTRQRIKDLSAITLGCQPGAPSCTAPVQ